MYKSDLSDYSSLYSNILKKPYKDKYCAQRLFEVGNTVTQRYNLVKLYFCNFRCLISQYSGLII